MSAPATTKIYASINPEKKSVSKNDLCLEYKLQSNTFWKFKGFVVIFFKKVTQVKIIDSRNGGGM